MADLQISSSELVLRFFWSVSMAGNRVGWMPSLVGIWLSRRRSVTPGEKLRKSGKKGERREPCWSMVREIAGPVVPEEAVRFCELSIVNQCRALLTLRSSDLENLMDQNVFDAPDPETCRSHRAIFPGRHPLQGRLLIDRKNPPRKRLTAVEAQWPTQWLITN